MPVEVYVMTTPSKVLCGYTLIENHLDFEIAALAPVARQLVKQPCPYVDHLHSLQQ